MNENLFVAPLIPFLEEIRLFVTLSKEVVILNFVDFPIGFFNYPERHLILLRTLAAELGSVAYTRPWDNSANSGDLTMEMMDRTGKSLLILYNDKSVVEGKTFFCLEKSQAKMAELFFFKKKAHLLKLNL